jgi:hypothetical protein
MQKALFYTMVLLMCTLVQGHLYAQSPSDTIPVPPRPDIPPTDTIPVPQPPQIPPTDSLSVERRNTEIETPSTQSDSARSVVEFDVYPLKMPISPGARVLETDSTLRWSQWNEWSDRISRSPSAISYRLGGFTRNDFHFMNGYEPFSQRFYLEGMSMRNPVTGDPLHQNFALERLSHLQEYSGGITLRTDMELQRYYSQEPTTRIYYDQSANQMRNTHAQLSQLIRKNWGYDLIYNGRNYSGEYQRAQTVSKQMSARTFFHINDRYLAQALILFNAAQLQESNGYQIADLPSFNFQTFFAPPIRTNASSSSRQSQVQVALIRRGNAPARKSIDQTSHKPADSRVILYHNRYRRYYDAPADTTNIRILSYHAAAQHNIDWGFVRAQAELRSGYFVPDQSRSRSLSVGNWSETEAEAHISLHPLPLLEIPLQARAMRRSDGFEEWESSAGGRINLFNRIALMGKVSVGERMPTIQQLYWQGNISGNPSLETSFDTRTEAGVEFTSGRWPLTLGVSAFMQEQSNRVFLLPDSTFGQFSNVGSQGGTFYGSFESARWEFRASTTIQQYESDNLEIPVQFLSGSGLRIWNKGSVHWKGYVLDNATYIKIGVYGMFSPNYYRTAQYIASMDYWEGSLQTQDIPFFARVDFDLTARVRNMFVLVRYENIADGLGQFGYYEASSYPMPSRRLRFGLRVLFRN